MQTWIYHKTEQPQIIDSKEYDSYHKTGWRDSPAPFLDVKDFDADTPEKVQQLGDTVQGVVDNLNGALNIDKMNKTELEEYALEHYGVDINPSNKRRLKRLRNEVKCLIDGVSD